MAQKTNNHIEEYFSQKLDSQQEKASKEIFKAEDNNVDIKTEVNLKEISSINAMKLNDYILKKYKLDDIFKNFYNPYMRLKISFDRKSRGEFVSINKQNDMEGLQEGVKMASQFNGGSR